MSFSGDLKSVITASAYKSACCRRALLLGALVAKGEIRGDRTVCINVDGDNSVKLISDTVLEVYGTEPDVFTPKSGGRCRSISFESRSCFAMLADQKKAKESALKLRCSLCKSALLRGIFLASGRASDPDKQFCLEFSIKNPNNALKDILSELGVEVKEITRRNERILYTKNSTAIEDFFALAELKEAAFKVMNVKIKKDIKNEANRIRNFETVNIARAVDAANEQYRIIKELSDRGFMSKLPEELRSTAELRLANPSMSLYQLSINSNPPISKSGISHRMEKIMKLAKELLFK